MNEQIKQLVDEARVYYNDDYNDLAKLQKFAEMIVRACADAADMAYAARCANPGDYVAEQLGCGVEEGVTEWRQSSKILELNNVSSI